MGLILFRSRHLYASKTLWSSLTWIDWKGWKRFDFSSYIYIQHCVITYLVYTYTILELRKEKRSRRWRVDDELPKGIYKQVQQGKGNIIVLTVCFHSDLDGWCVCVCTGHSREWKCPTVNRRDFFLHFFSPLRPSKMKLMLYWCALYSI